VPGFTHCYIIFSPMHHLYHEEERGQRRQRESQTGVSSPCFHPPGCEPSLFGKKAMRMDSPTVPPHASVSKTHAAFRSGQVRAARGGGRAWACRRGTRRCARLWRACRGVAHMAPGCAALSPVPIRRAKCWGAASPFPCPPRAGATCRREWRSDGSGGERSYQMCASNFARQARATAPRGHALRCMCPMTVVVAGAGREWGSEAPCVYARL